MKNTLLLLTVFLFVTSCDSDDNNTENNNIFEGNVLLTTQAEVNDFGNQNYHTINGGLTIRRESPSQTSDINDLTPLSSLTAVTGRLWITNCDNLSTLDGLNNLGSVLNLSVFGNEKLTSISALSNMTAIESYIRIKNNPVLTSLNGLNQIENSNSVIIINNSALTSLQGLNALTTTKSLEISGNANLQTVDGLENLTNLGSYGATNLGDLKIGVMWVDIGPSLQNYPNPNLTDFCALQNLFVNGNGLERDVVIQNNAYNPTAQDISNGNCSQ